MQRLLLVSWNRKARRLLWLVLVTTLVLGLVFSRGTLRSVVSLSEDEQLDLIASKNSVKLEKFEPVVDSCVLTPILLKRYAPLRTFTKGKKVLFGLSLRNARPIIQNLRRELSLVFEVLGQNTSAISIYENGSSDGSSELLNDFANRLKTLGIENRILAGDQAHDWGQVHRIGKLAELRNHVLEPLLNNSKAYRALQGL